MTEVEKVTHTPRKYDASGRMDKNTIKLIQAHELRMKLIEFMSDTDRLLLMTALGLGGTAALAALISGVIKDEETGEEVNIEDSMEDFMDIWLRQYMDIARYGTGIAGYVGTKFMSGEANGNFFEGGLTDVIGKFAGTASGLCWLVLILRAIFGGESGQGMGFLSKIIGGVV